MVVSINERAQDILEKMGIQPEAIDPEANEKIRDLVTLTRGAHLLAKQLQEMAEDEDPMVADYYPLTFASAEAKKHAERIFGSRCMPEN